jgi:hypothetical protein
MGQMTEKQLNQDVRLKEAGQRSEKLRSFPLT